MDHAGHCYSGGAVVHRRMGDMDRAWGHPAMTATLDSGRSLVSEPSALKVENGASGNSDGRAAAVAQILLECRCGARTLDPSLEIVSGLLDKGYAIVPVEPTHAMERAYFSAPLPAFVAEASGRKRRKHNKLKMQSRWAAMLRAATT